LTKDLLSEITQKTSVVVNMQLKPKFLADMYLDYRSISHPDLKKLFLLEIFRNFHKYMESIILSNLLAFRIQQCADVNYFNAIKLIYSNSTLLTSIRLSSCRLTEDIRTTLIYLMQLKNVENIQLYNIFFPDDFAIDFCEGLKTSCVNTIFLDKITFDNEELFLENLSAAVNDNSKINNISLKRLKINDISEMLIEKLISSSQNLANMEITFSKESANKHHFYRKILNSLVENKNLEFINLDDFKVEACDIPILEQIYENRRLINKDIVLLVNLCESLNFDDKLLIIELYLNYLPKIFKKLEYSGFTLIYNYGVMMIEILDLSKFDDIEFYIKKFAIEKIVFKLTTYNNTRQFFKKLRGLDIFNEITLSNPKEDRMFIEYFSEFLYATKSLRKLTINMDIDMLSMSQCILMGVVNNRNCKIELKVNDLNKEYIDKVLDFFRQRKDKMKISKSKTKLEGGYNLVINKEDIN
jgi:hypothetical protein